MKGKRLLLVEDNEKILRGNQRLLEWEGYEVDAARTLEQAEQCFEARRPDAVILDIMLPDGNGLEYMKALRQGRDGDVPILLLTGLTSQEDVIQGLAAGGDDYLTKPYDFPILLARIEALLRRADRIPKTLQAGKLVLDNHLLYSEYGRAGSSADPEGICAVITVCTESGTGDKRRISL